MEFLFVCCKLLKRGPRLQNLAWISTSQRAELIDSVVIVQVLSQSQLQNWHVAPASDFDYFWTKSHMCLELGFYITALLSNILQMLSPEGGSAFQGAQTLLKQNCFSGFWCVIRTWAAASAACRWAGAACSPQPEQAVPHPIWVLLSLCHPAKPEPSAPSSTQVSQGSRLPPSCVWQQTCPWDCETPCAIPPHRIMLPTLVQILSPAILHRASHAPEAEPNKGLSQLKTLWAKPSPWQQALGASDGKRESRKSGLPSWVPFQLNCVWWWVDEGNKRPVGFN